MDNLNFDVKAMLSPPDIMGCKRVLCVQPHPDDNEIGIGGIIARLAQQGCEVHYLTLTDGSQGGRTADDTPEKTAVLRKQETEDAGRHLGVENFHYLNHADGTLEAVVPLAVEIANIIRQVRPEAVFAPDPWLMYEGHYDHVITGRAAANAFMMSGRQFLPGGRHKPFAASAICYYFTQKPNTVIDVSDVFDKKFEAIAMHKSQMDEEMLAMYRLYFGMKGQELAAGRGFALGEGLKVLGPLHTHCFVDAVNI